VASDVLKAENIIARPLPNIALWADLGSKLVSTRSVPEAFEAYAKCLSQQMKMTVEDGQHLLNDWKQAAQRITEH
jgi:hypothetical protein